MGEPGNRSPSPVRRSIVFREGSPMENPAASTTKATIPAAVDSVVIVPSNQADISTTLASFEGRSERLCAPAGALASASLLQAPLLSRQGPAASLHTALKRNVAPATLLSDVLSDSLFQLLLPAYTTAGSATAIPAAAAPEDRLLASPVPSEVCDTSVLPFSPSSAISKDQSEWTSIGRADPQDITLALPSTRVPPPSMLLVALADMDVLQQSFYAHTCVWPAKGQMSEFKKLVAASMKAELSNGDFSSGEKALMRYEKGEGNDVTSTMEGSNNGSEDHDSTSGEEPTRTPTAAIPAASSVGARQAHDAAVRAALHSAHGFLYGTETVPTGVPKAHLQRARQRWVREYRSLYVQPWLMQAQRHRYEIWRLQESSSRRCNTYSNTKSVPSPRKGLCQFPQGFSMTSMHPAVTPATACAALKPTFWRKTSIEMSSGALHAAADATTMTKEGSALFTTTGRWQRALMASQDFSGSARSTANKDGAAISAAWEIDLYDDMQLVATSQMSYSTADQVALRSTIEDSDMQEPGDAAESSIGVATAPLSTEALSSLSALSAGNKAAAGRLGLSADLTKMQLPLPVFVYVISRYLFLAHYAAHFPPGLFSSALINPFYFPDAAQCTAAYALRAVPALRREADIVRASYAAQLADMCHCFPERAAYMEVPLPRHDVLHLWELLCPPQKQDCLGQWQPVHWGHLLPDEEDALLESEYVTEANGGGGDRSAFYSSHASAGPPQQERPLLSFGYGRAARRVYRDRLQQLAQNPALLAEVRRLLAVCEDVAMHFFSTVDTEQRGCITWEELTNALIEEADICDHQLRVREHAAQLTRTSASVFDRYVVEPLPPALVRLGYTGSAFEVRHSASLVMVEGATDYAVCDGTQLGSIRQRFMVRPIEVVLKELEAVPQDAFGRPLRSAGALVNRDWEGEDGELTRGRGKSRGGVGDGGTTGYDVALRLHPWRNNQQPVRSFVRYEDGRRLQESTALSVLQQLSGSGPSDGAGGDDENEDGNGCATEHEGATQDGSSSPLVWMHQPGKPVSLQAAMAVEDVSPYVPWTVFIALSNDMLLRLYSSNRAVQALPEAGLLRCVETVTCMEWAAGGSHGRAKLLENDTFLTSASAAVANGERRPSDPGASVPAASSSSATPTLHPSRTRTRLSIQRQEYLILGTRSGMLCLIDLYAALHKVPRLTTSPSAGGPTSNLNGGREGELRSSSTGSGGDNDTNAQKEGGASGAGGAGKFTSEHIGSSSNAWSGYRALAQRTYYSDISPFEVHRRQVHAPGTVVSSVIAAASNGLFVSSGLDGDVYTMRLGFPAEASSYSPRYRADRGLLYGARPGMTAVNSDGTTTTTTERPLLCIEVLHRLSVSETGVRHALPIPSLSMLAVQTVSNKVYMYHTSVLPTWTPLADNVRPESAANRREKALITSRESLSQSSSTNPASTSSRLELYDAASPHLGSMVAVIAVEELDQLLTVDSTGYVKVWSLRQAQPLTSFYAVAPVQPVGLSDKLSGQATPSGGGGTDGSCSANSALNKRPSTQGGGARGSSNDKGFVSSLLRTTKHSIEAAVEAAESRLQPCLSAAYNHAGRQLYVMGSNNAALCFFMSGQSSARAHTNPLRVLLIGMASRGRGQLHHRLISLSSADCRVWSLLTGAMELGIRASNAEYRNLFNHRLTGQPETATARRNDVEVIEGNSNNLDGQGSRVAGGGSARARSGKNARSRTSAMSASSAAPLVLANLTSMALTTGEARRHLPRSVDDVIRAVSARPESARSHAYNLRVITLSRKSSARATSANTKPEKSRAQGKAVTTATTAAATTAAGTANDTSRETSRAATASKTHPSPNVFTAAETENTDLLPPGALRDQNVLTSEIRCACIGPEGQWVGYALLHGEIRLHRTDSGRLLHTFVTTPPSMTELLQVALQYEHLFALSSSSAPSPPPAPAFTTEMFALSTSSVDNTPPKLNAVAGNANSNRPALPKSVSAPATGGSGKAQHTPPKSMLTTVAYAQAVAVVLQRLLTSVRAGQRFGPFSTRTAASSSAAALSAAGSVLDSGSRDVHREPLHMFYVEASQEVFVVYADGLVRVFTLLGHRTTASRVIVSRTLVNRALEQVRQVLDREWSPLQQPQQFSLPSPTMSLTKGKTKTVELTAQQQRLHSTMTLQELIMTDAITSVGLVDTDADNTGSNTRQSSRGFASCLATTPGTAPSLLLDTSNQSDRTPDGRRLVGAPPTTTPTTTTSTTTAVGALNSPPLLASTTPTSSSAVLKQLEPDVVLLATASPPLGLICLVHASGLVTVMDIQATGDDPLARLGNQSAENGGGLGRAFAERAVGGGGTAAVSGIGDFSRSQSGVVVHSFITSDEVTAATFLGAYPCLVLADRQRTLSFHLMKGSSMLAMLGDFAERLQQDTAQLLSGGAATKPSPMGILTGVSGGSSAGASRPSSSSSTLIWTTSIEDTCASVHVLGSVTVLAFDPLYATLYVGTSQGYIMSYLVRRLLLAFQLTPVFLSGVDGVAVTTYATELQRSGSRHPMTPSPKPPTAGSTMGSNSSNSGIQNFFPNFLHVLFDIPLTNVRERLSVSPLAGDRMAMTNAATGARAAPVYDPDRSSLLCFYQSHQELFRPPPGETGSSSNVKSALLLALVRCPASLFVAAAVLHDAVTRMRATAAVQDGGTNSSNSRKKHSVTSTELHNGTQPWWTIAVGGGLVKEYLTRQCNAASESAAQIDGTPYASAEDDKGAPTGMQSALKDTELELDKEGVQLLREWVCSALVAPRRSDQATAGRAFAGAYASSSKQRLGGLNDLENSTTDTALPPPPPTRYRSIENDTPSRSSLSVSVPRRVGGDNTPTPTTARTVADALVQEVEEELLFGDTATALHDQRVHAPFTALDAGELVDPYRRHPITEAWVEPIFTRHAMAMASRSPLCLLTPPAMLERARRERLDRLARRPATAPLPFSSANTNRPTNNAKEKDDGTVEWDYYVEGAPPDYLADMLSRPGRVLPQAERQALRQRAITALQCRRNGYLCIGHADGGVTLWTPYACGRLESLCPSTSLPASLDRLSRSVQMHFQYVHERVVLERQRLAFEGAVYKRTRNEQEEKAHMKQRIRQLLLDHHLSQLYQEVDDGDVRGSDFREVRKVSAVHTNPTAGVLEKELLTMRPLLCLLLGIASPAELHARQLSLEDLCFLPLRMESIASLEAFQIKSYTAAIEVAMRRLRRELMEVDDVSAQQTSTSTTTAAAFCRSGNGRETQPIPCGSNFMGVQKADALSPSRSVSLNTRQMPQASTTASVTPSVRCVYDYPLSLLALMLNVAFHPHISPGLMTFPGAVRLLLHRVLDGAPPPAGSGRPTGIWLTHSQATTPAMVGKSRTAATTTAPTSTRAQAAATGPPEGEYFEVCHALQLAEVEAETLWEVGELHRLRACLQRAEDSPQGHTDLNLSRSTDSANSRRRKLRQNDEDGVEDSIAQLPPSSAMAVSAAVRRQLRRQLEGRLAALSQRAVASAKLCRMGLQLRSLSNSEDRWPKDNGFFTTNNNSDDSSFFARLTRGTGLAWVQATLRQQSRFAFAEPCLKLPAPILKCPSTAGPTTKLRAAAAVKEVRCGWMPSTPTLSTAQADTTTTVITTAAPLSAFASAAAFAPASPIPTAASESLTSLNVATPMVSPPLHTDAETETEEGSAAAASVGAMKDEGFCLESSVLNKSSTIPEIFLTELNTDSQQADAAGPDSNVESTSQPLLSPHAVFHEFENRPVGRLNSPSPSANLLKQLHDFRTLPFVPLHRTKLARTGGSRPQRTRPAASAAASADPHKICRALSMDYTADAMGITNTATITRKTTKAAATSPRGSAGKAPLKVKTSAPAVRAAKLSPSPTSSYTCYSLFSRSGTTK